MKQVTIIRNWGAFSPGDVIEADAVRAEQLVEQGIGVLGRQTVNSVDVAKAVDISEARAERARRKKKK